MDEKIKVPFEKCDMSGSFTVKDSNENVIVVKDRIPYEEKEKMAFELAELTTVIDEEKQVCFRSYNSDVILMYLIVKYYTNVDITDAPYAQVYDWVTANRFRQTFFSKLKEELDRILCMADDLFYAAKATYEREHSLSYKLMKTFGSLFEGEDIMETIAKMPEVNNLLTEMMNAWKKQREAERANTTFFEEPRIVPLKSSKKNHIKISGAMLNMAKKN